MTTGDAGRLIGLSGRMVRSLIARGDLPASLINRRWVVRIRDIEQLLDDKMVEKITTNQ